MSSNHHRPPAAPGRVDGATLLNGAVGLLVAVVMNWTGLLARGDQRVYDLLHQPVFHGVEVEVLGTPVLIALTALFCFGLAFAILDSPGLWRRVVLGLTVFILVAAMVPTLAVWKIYFPPMVTMVGVFWTWFCALMYVSHHQMPCDVVNSPIQVPATGSETEVQSEEEKKEVKKAAKKTVRKKTDKGQQANEMDKYKPKD